MGKLKEEYINNIPSDEALDEWYRDYVNKGKREGKLNEKRSEVIHRTRCKIYDA
jgi:hypothetical protein